MSSGAFVVVLVLGSGGAAEACSCAFREATHPADGATGVPRNAVVQVTQPSRGGSFDGVELVDADGGVVPADRVQRTELTLELRPRELLAPNARYGVIGLFQSDGASFTTGATEDVTPPSLPTITTTTSASGLGLGSSCGGFEWIRLELDGASDDTTPAGALAYELVTGPSPASLGAEPSPDLLT